MTTTKALSTVLLWGIVLALLGGLMGAVLGHYFPDFYRSVFENGYSAGFNPLHVGVGLGMTQGLAGGMAIALGVLALMAWRERRLSVPASTMAMAVDFVSRQWRRFALRGAVVASAVVAFGVLAFVTGAIIGQQQIYRSSTIQKMRRVTPILASREFQNVHAASSSAAHVYLTGSVPDDETLADLREKLIRVFGTEEADAMIRTVDVSNERLPRSENDGS